MRDEVLEMELIEVVNKHIKERGIYPCSAAQTMSHMSLDMLGYLSWLPTRLRWAKYCLEEAIYHFEERGGHLASQARELAGRARDWAASESTWSEDSAQAVKQLLQQISEELLKLSGAPASAGHEIFPPSCATH